MAPTSSPPSGASVGLRVHVISGTEEARLIHLAAAYAADIGKRTGVVIDIGGGSTEITVGTAERMQTGRSFKLGVIRLTERFVTTDPLSGRDERRLVRHIRGEAARSSVSWRAGASTASSGRPARFCRSARSPPTGARPTMSRNLRVSAKALHAA